MKSPESSTPPDHPGVIAPPPLIFLAALLLSVFLHQILPLSPLPALWGFIGVGLMLMACIPGPWAVIEMLRARTGIEPHQPATQLVTGGPFRFTRNPIYLTMALFVFGFGLVIGTLWVFPALSLALLVLHHGVIFREERYLTRKFGDMYRQYRARVRRWL